MIDIEALKVDSRKFSWRTVMTVYMRVLSVLWLLAGVVIWARIIGIAQFGGIWFWELPVEIQVAAVYFAVLSLVAGVGLWLTVSWGTVLWLLAAASQIIFHTVMTDMFGSNTPAVIGNVLTVLAYLGLVFLMEREESK
ncbi:DUF6163 family protein [Amorphus orientalis]|uniref:Uncharacterized protein n=1 Tax=Amorphus orientalis TaxID=649198 RepID=A0AAE3VNU5_9HYPH|nr:DUF6163 family protein [Amorphus orientalis]MDQ0316059.1 hypothetical protein [Amorphus orientalis]